MVFSQIAASSPNAAQHAPTMAVREKRDGAAATSGSTAGTLAPLVIVSTCVRNSPAVW